MADIPFVDPSKILIVALEGWNDAGDAASDCASMVVDHFGLVPLASVDPEEYFDFQLTRPMVSHEVDGSCTLNWPDVTLVGQTEPERTAPLVLLGQEPSRLWRSFAAQMVDHALAYDVEGIIFLGSMLADVPHSRPVTVTATSDDPTIREALDVEKSSYEGPVGVLTVLSLAAAEVGIPSLHLWAHVPHYVHTAPSPKATLALLDRLEDVTGISIDREDLEVEALRWEEGIDALAGDDDDMSAYIDQLERQRDAADAPEATGDAIAQEFEKYLRGRPERPGSTES
jgi:proteasome assembly chaperone (PAC2) family protein